MRRVTLVVGLITCLAVLGTTMPASADTDYIPSSWNGYKIYLSPAGHSPDNTGCNNYKENVGAQAIAKEAALKLKAKGFKVRVGSGNYSANTSSSNSWGADIHVPIHSNATTSDCTSPFNPLRGGTWFMYYSTAGKNLSNALKAAQAAAPSPGTNDKVCTDSACFGGGLYELRNTNAVAAYIEAAFHTYRPDVDYLRKPATVGSWIAEGIDVYLGRPRPCPASFTIPTSIQIPIC